MKKNQYFLFLLFLLLVLVSWFIHRHWRTKRKLLLAPLHPSHYLDKQNELPIITHPSALNRTSESQLVFYNRIPKCGSTSLFLLMFKIEDDDDFNVEHSLIFHKRFLSPEDQNSLIYSLIWRARSTFFDRHVLYINFNKVGLENPIYVNMVRDPVDRELSVYFYERSEKHIELMKEQYSEQYKAPDKEWLDMDINEAILNLTDSQFSTMVAGRQRLGLVAYFCGHDSFCVEHGNKEAILQAKYNIEFVYSVIGVLEELEKSLQVFEAYIPRFFTGATSFNKQSLSYNINPERRRSVSTPTIRKLKELLQPDYEIYDFIKERLALQYHNIKGTSL